MKTHTENSYLAPALACNGATALLAWTDTTAHTMFWKKTTNRGSTWAASHATTYSTGLPPALAYAPGHGWWLLAFADPVSSKVRVLISKDSGVSFGSLQSLDALRASEGLGLVCRSDDYCILTYSTARQPATHLISVALTFDLNGNLTYTTENDLGYPSYGSAVALGDSGSGWTFVWRDRGAATPFVDGNYFSGPPIYSYFQSATTQTSPSLTWEPINGDFWARYSYGSQYNQ